MGHCHGYDFIGETEYLWGKARYFTISLFLFKDDDIDTLMLKESLAFLLILLCFGRLLENYL